MLEDSVWWLTENMRKLEKDLFSVIKSKTENCKKNPTQDQVNLFILDLYYCFNNSCRLNWKLQLWHYHESFYLEIVQKRRENGALPLLSCSADYRPHDGAIAWRYKCLFVNVHQLSLKLPKLHSFLCQNQSHNPAHRWCIHLNG